MGITRLRRIKEDKKGRPSFGLKRNIFYICDEKKTAGGLYIGGNAGYDPAGIYQTMLQNKEFFGKLDGSQGFHYMISFHADDPVDASLACKIAEEFSKELLGDDYYYVYAVHLDKKHLHVHLTFDSVSKTDGKKFHSPNGDWEMRIQPITDRLCTKYHLPSLHFGEDRRGKPYGEWKREQRPEEKKKDTYTWFDIIRDDIDAAINKASDYESFLKILQEQKYVIRGKKYLSLCPYGKERSVRTGRLGDGYSKEEIIRRIQEKPILSYTEERYKTYGDYQEMKRILCYKVKRCPGWRMSFYQRQFYQRWHRTYLIRKPGKKQIWKYKKDILEINRLAECLQYLISHDIRDEAGLSKKREELFIEREAVSLRVRSLQTKLYRGEVTSLVNRYERLQKMKEAETDEEIQYRLDMTKRKIEEICSFEEAVRLRDEVRKHLREEQKILRILKKEAALLEEIERFSQDPLHLLLLKGDTSIEKKTEDQEVITDGSHTKYEDQLPNDERKEKGREILREAEALRRTDENRDRSR